MAHRECLERPCDVTLWCDLFALEEGLSADLPPLKWSSLKYDFRMDGAAPFCGPVVRQFLGLFEFVVRTRSAPSYRARYGVCRCCSSTSILRSVQ